jgi:hypothetical protein
MKKFLLITCLSISGLCFAQETVPKVDIANPPPRKDRQEWKMEGKNIYTPAADSIRLNPTPQKDQSNGASDFMYGYTRTVTAGLIFNAVGSGLMVAGIVIKPKTPRAAENQRNVYMIGGTINIIGLIFQLAAQTQMNRAATRLEYHKHTSILINENGIGLALAIN